MSVLLRRPMDLKTQFDPFEAIEDRAVKRREVAMARTLSEILQRIYPGHGWAAMADARGGVCGIRIPALMPPTLWFVIHMNTVQGYPEMFDRLKEAGGQILERYRLRRAAFDVDTFREALPKKMLSFKDGMPE